MTSHVYSINGSWGSWHQVCPSRAHREPKTHCWKLVQQKQKDTRHYLNSKHTPFLLFSDAKHCIYDTAMTEVATESGQGLNHLFYFLFSNRFNFKLSLTFYLSVKAADTGHYTRIFSWLSPTKLKLVCSAVFVYLLFISLFSVRLVSESSLFVYHWIIGHCLNLYGLNAAYSCRVRSRRWDQSNTGGGSQRPMRLKRGWMFRFKIGGDQLVKLWFNVIVDLGQSWNRPVCGWTVPMCDLRRLVTFLLVFYVSVQFIHVARLSRSTCCTETGLYTRGAAILGQWFKVIGPVKLSCSLHQHQV